MQPLPLIRPLLLLLLPLHAGVGGAAAQTAEPAPAPPARLSLEDFRALHWLAGDWRGEAPGGAPFYESYHLRDDSTLVITHHADSTFTRPTGTGTVELRGGRIQHRSGDALWAVSRLDATGVSFAPVERARNHFEWRRETPDRWTATLSFPGRPARVYHLRRVRG